MKIGSMEERRGFHWGPFPLHLLSNSRSLSYKVGTIFAT